MDEQPATPQTPGPPAGAPRGRALWPLAAVAIVAVLGAGAGAYFGLRGAAGPGSGPGVSPPPRAFAAAAYDEASHQVVLFGGIGATGSALNDTWTWDGSTWVLQHPPTSPPARAYAAMTYDPKARDLVLVGGRSVNYSPSTVCSGGIAAGGPNATPGVAHSPAACKASPPNVFSDTWVWNGSTWRVAGTAPTVLVGGTLSLGTDPTTGQVLMLGEKSAVGMNPACPSPAPSFPPGTPIPQVAVPCTMSPRPSVAAWVWNGTSWTELTAGSVPPEPGVAVDGIGALAADPTSGHLVEVWAGVEYACAGAASPTAPVPCPLVEGSSGASSSSGSVAPVPVPVAPAPLPSAIPVPMPTSVPAPVHVTCCTDSVTTWTGAAWSTPKTVSDGPQVEPSGISGDPAQHELVAVTPQGTWTWNGATWKAEHPATSPAPAGGSSLVYDGVSGKLLLFGGELTTINRSSGLGIPPAALQVSDELWAWDGTTWSQLTGSKTSPAPSLSPAPTPTFVPPGTPLPGSPAPTRGPLPTPRPGPCTPAPTETPTPTPTETLTPSPSQGAGSGFSCGPIAVPPTSG